MTNQVEGASRPFVEENDPSLHIERLSVATPSGEQIAAYLALTPSEEKVPGVIVVHARNGLVAYIEDVTRRLAKEGFVALAPDLLSPLGGTAVVGEGAGPALRGRSPVEMADELESCVGALAKRPEVDSEKIGVIGFCFGGGMALRLATRGRLVQAAVSFYGMNPPLEDVKNVDAPILSIYAGTDTRVNGGIDAIEEAMATNGKLFEKQMYEGAAHAFHDNTEEFYHPEAAKQSWELTLTRLHEWLDNKGE